MWIVGNFKKNPKTLNEVRTLSTDLVQILMADFADDLTSNTIAVAPSFVHLAPVAEILADSAIALAVQDVSATAGDIGAFTGGVSAAQVADMGASLAIIGHSERRSLGDHNFLAKINHALAANLTVIFCVGESLAEYDADATLTVLQQQLDGVLAYDNLNNDIIIAYEPMWAIGTGRTPTVDDITNVCAFIKQTVNKPVLYGGSVNEQTAKELVAISQIDGVLVGGASLDAQKFAQIVGTFIKR